MFADDFTSELRAIQAAPFDDASRRADQEADTVLGSGRTPVEAIDFAQELVAIVHDRWNSDEFVGVPAPIKANVLAVLKRLRTRIEEYASSQGSPADFDKEVDQLHVLAWQNDLVASPEGKAQFAAKNAQLERLKDKGRRINRELKKGLAYRDTLKKGANGVAETEEHITALSTKAASALEAIQSTQASVQELLEVTKEEASETTRLEKSAAQLLERIKASDNEVGALTEKIKLFYKTIDEHTQEMETFHNDSSKRFGELEDRSKAIVTRHEELQEQVDEQLQKATGASLFHAFQSRRSALSRARWIWAGISIFALVVTVVWSIFLAESAGSLDTAFFVKLSGTLPVLALVVFCLSQYGRERGAEEEYAFKSALSLSLVPYKELIENLETRDGDAEYAKFLTSTIGQIYAPPRLTKDGKGKSDPSTPKVVQAVNELVEKLVNR